MNLHILGIPNTITKKDFFSCEYTQSIYNFINMFADFDFFDDITSSKSNIMKVLSEEQQNDYSPYFMNQALAQSADSIMYVNDMNGLPHLPVTLQYDYFINSIRRRSRRLEKWLIDPSKSDTDLGIVKEYFNYSNQKAKDALLLLGESELEYIRY